MKWRLIVFSVATIWVLQNNAISVIGYNTVRYQQGYLQGGSVEVESSISVAAAREHCVHNVDCVSFAFQSPLTRFPAQNVSAFFYSYADWHVMPSTGEPAFVEDPSWHLYVNITREQDAVPNEIRTVLGQLMNGSPNLRGTKEEVDHTIALLSSLYHIVYPKELKVIAAPLMVPDMIRLALSTEEANIVRQSAMNVLHVVADTDETGTILMDANVYQAMKTIIYEKKETSGKIAWDDISTVALSVISNICLYRSVNTELRKHGASEFLASLLSEPGFPGLQAAMALTHLGVGKVNMPHDKIHSMVDMLRNTIDGDVAYGILWDLIPGPLSAIQFLVLHDILGDKGMLDLMLDAGLMEQLLRILEADCLVPSHVQSVLEILHTLSSISERARHTILLAEHSLHEVESRLKEYGQSADLASSLLSAVSKNFFLGSEL